MTLNNQHHHSTMFTLLTVTNHENNIYICIHSGNYAIPTLSDLYAWFDTLDCEALEHTARLKRLVLVSYWTVVNFFWFVATLAADFPPELIEGPVLFSLYCICYTIAISFGSTTSHSTDTQLHFLWGIMIYGH